MTSMNVSLPEQMKDWVEGKITGGQYHNASEYIRDLIRKDQAEDQKTKAFAMAIELGRGSGTDNRSFNDIMQDAKKAAKAKSKK